MNAGVNRKNLVVIRDLFESLIQDSFFELITPDLILSFGDTLLEKVQELYPGNSFESGKNFDLQYCAGTSTFTLRFTPENSGELKIMCNVIKK